MREKLTNLLTDKGTQASAEVARAMIKNPSRIDFLFEGMDSKKAKIKYGCARALLLISETKPELLYSYFNEFTELIAGKNNILKWTAIDIICNLSRIDDEDKLNKKLLNVFYSMINEDSLITAAHVVGNLWKIAVNNNKQADKIADELLHAENNNISDECKCILAGHILDSFTKFYSHLSHNKKKEVLAYAEDQTYNSRKGTRKKATMFVKMFIV